MERADVVIAGGGFAGLALGIALRQGLGSAFAIIVADPFIGRDGSGDLRASAIAAGARRLFETIGVWEAVAQEAQPILDMAVTDSRLSCGAHREGPRARDRLEVRRGDRVRIDIRPSRGALSR